MWLATLIIFVVISILGGRPVLLCTAPFTVLAGLITAIYGVQLYYTSSQRSLSKHLIEQEMVWLYGDDWSNTTSQAEYAFAQERILKRYLSRWMFLFHVLLFIPIIGFTLYESAVYTGSSSLSILLYTVTAIWLLFLVRHARQAFPTAGMLERRERKVGEAIELEIEALRLDKQKRGEKDKHHTHVVLSDDGELLEVPETSDTSDAKSKREIG
jgi:hypothetical protein